MRSYWLWLLFLWAASTYYFSQKIPSRMVANEVESLPANQNLKILKSIFLLEKPPRPSSMKLNISQRVRNAFTFHKSGLIQPSISGKAQSVVEKPIKLSLGYRPEPVPCGDCGGNTKPGYFLDQFGDSQLCLTCNGDGWVSIEDKNPLD